MGSITGNPDVDVELMYPALRLPVTAGPILRRTKWRGGVYVTYVSSPEGDFVVEQSDGNSVAGFLLFPSERYSPLVGSTFGPDFGSNADWTSAQPGTHIGGQNVVTMIRDGTRAFFRVFETVALAGGTRSGGPIVYNLMDDLKVSENGLLCNDSDVELALAGVLTPVEAGIVAAVPSARNAYRLGVDTE